MPSVEHDRFVGRARREAARYGGGPLVFLRELVQNARDAGAARVSLTVEERPESFRITCRDDGSGMTADHARRFLFRLYASSKGRVGEAGRFGVGFWSVLRFEPSRLVVRSRHAGHPAWGVALDGGLAQTSMSPPPGSFAPGTEVSLEREVAWPGLKRAVRAALLEQVRDVRRLDRPRAPLSIRMDGEELNRPLDHAPPCVTFAAGAERGAVGLADAPRVEVFSLGLRVREARTLDELVGGPSSRAWSAVPGLAPALALESAHIAPLLSRADLRADAPLRRLERRARAALRRLMEAELERLHPASWAERLRAHAQAWSGVGAFAVTLAVGLGLLVRLAPQPSPPAGIEDGTFAAAALAGAAPGSVEVPLTADLGLHREPGLRALHGSQPTLALRYAPATDSVLLALRRTSAAELLGPPAVVPADAPVVPDAAALPAALRVRVRVGAGGVPLPVLAGTAPGRLRPAPLQATPGAVGVPRATFAAGFAGWVEYDLAPTPEPRPGAVARSDLPHALAEAARALRGLPEAQRPPAALAFVRSTLREARDESSARRFAQAAGSDFPSRALASGVGDCDVINGVLALLLDGAGVPARLAVGVVGLDGRALPGLHAWAEFHDGRRWRTLDATQPSAAAETPPTAARIETALAGPALAGSAPPPGPPAAPLGPPSFRRGWAWGLLALGLGGAIGFARLARRTRVRTGGTSIDELVRGALRHPEAFAGAPAIFDRPLLPLASGGCVSLGEAWREAALGRLYRTRQPEQALAREATARRAIVLDGAAPVAATVADALGAVDLDAWETRWREARPHSALDRLIAACATAGLRFEARLWPGERLDALPVAARGPRPRLLVGEAAPVWAARTSRASARGQFELAQAALVALGVPAELSAQALAPLARAALEEAAS